MMRIPACPDENTNDLNGKDLRAHVTKDHKVIIGGTELPAYIESGGLRIESGGKHGINRLVVRFLVGDIEIDDEAISDVDIIGERSTLKDAFAREQRAQLELRDAMLHTREVLTELSKANG